MFHHKPSIFEAKTSKCKPQICPPWQRSKAPGAKSLANPDQGRCFLGLKQPVENMNIYIYIYII